MSCEDINVSHEDLQWHHAVTWLTCRFVSGRLGEGGLAPVDPGHLGDQFVALALGPAAHGVQGGQVDDGLQVGAHDRRELVGGQGLGLNGLAQVVPRRSVDFCGAVGRAYSPTAQVSWPTRTFPVTTLSTGGEVALISGFLQKRGRVQGRW